MTGQNTSPKGSGRLASDSIDTSTPHPARVYDAWLGGKDNYAADRAVAEQTVKVAPETLQSVKDNRAFLTRATEYLVRCGIRKFVDIGSGLPTVKNTHQVAQASAADARVVYVDNDPIVRAHGLALLSDMQTTIVEGDLRRPADILSKPELLRLIDIGEPVGLLLVAVLHFIADDEDPYGLVRQLVGALAPGSHVVISHLTGDGADPERVAEVMEIWRRANAAVVPTVRSHTEILRFFDGLGMTSADLSTSDEVIVDQAGAGLVPINQWRQPERRFDEWFWLHGGVGVKGGT